ncbi:MAG: NADH-quinone oxidoreductase subunit M [Anaerolineae bacterium]|nr:NADH-quinone oxidoreductase subunit M [Anaerolineae bacterium]
MNRLGFPLLSILILVPLAGAVITLAVGRRRQVAQVWALVVSLATLALAGTVWALFNYGRGGMQFVDRVPWVETLGISYYVGVDGISLWLLLLTAFLVPVAIIASWRSVSHWPAEDVRAYFFWLLALETGVLGVFAAVDMVLFFIFWEAMLVPAYFLIGRWGGERRMYATVKFFLYTMAGSALMLVAILVLAALGFQQTGEMTFDRLALEALPLGLDAQIWLFLAFALAFAVKAPVWPFHSWLPPAYVEAPTPVTILLAGLLSKMGIYGLIRFCIPLFPDALAVARPWIWPLVVVGIVYASLVALVQSDLKRLIAYSSMAHVGIIVAGVLAANVQGVQGALLQSVSHGITVSALFLIVEFLAVRRGTQIETLGGLWHSVPLLGTLTLTVIMAAIGLPGLSGFPGEFTLLLGLLRQSPAAAAAAATGIVLGAWYMLSLFSRVFAGPLDRPENRTLPDLRRREGLLLLPLVVLMFVLGILPGLVLRPTDAAVADLLAAAEENRVVLIESGE